MATLYDAIKTTLTEAVERSAGLAAADLKSEKKSGLRVHGRTGQACPVCGNTVREVSFADSALQYCPTCQTGGKPLADRRLSRLPQINAQASSLPGTRSNRCAPGTLENLGAIAQMEERLVCIQKARGSSPP